MKYLEKGEFRDLKYVKNIKLDGNQLSVIIDNLFESQRNLEFLGNKSTIYVKQFRPDRKEKKSEKPRNGQDKNA